MLFNQLTDDRQLATVSPPPAVYALTDSRHVTVIQASTFQSHSIGEIAHTARCAFVRGG